MERTSRHYAKLLKAQVLVREQEEARLETARRDLAALEENSHYLFSLMHQGACADFVDPMLVARRLTRNRQAEAVLQARIDATVGAVLQASRRCDILREKQRAALGREERGALADMLEEFVARQCL